MSNDPRPSPVDASAERAVLGALMLDGSRLDEVRARLTAADFYAPEHGRLFGLLCGMHDAGEPIDDGRAVPSKIIAEADEDRRYGGLTNVLRMTEGVPSAINVMHYAGIVADRARQRRVLRSLERATDAVHRGEDLDELGEHVRQAFDSATTKRGWLAEAWQTAAAGGWLDETSKPADRPWLLRTGPSHETPGVDVLPRGKTGIVGGAGAIGKSTAMLDLAMAVALAEPGTGRVPEWLAGTFAVASNGGHPAASACGCVLVVLGEEDETDAHRRLWNLAKARGYSTAERRRIGERLVVVPAAGHRMALLDDEGNASPFLAQLRQRLRNPPAPDGWALLVLDPLARFAPGDAEKDNAVATRLVETLETLTTSPGLPTVLAVHHTSQDARNVGKTDATAIRGVGGLTDGVRWVATLTAIKIDGYPGRPGVRFEVAKTNYAKAIAGHRLVCGSGGSLTQPDATERAWFATGKAPPPPEDNKAGGAKTGGARNRTEPHGNSGAGAAPTAARARSWAAPEDET